MFRRALGVFIVVLFLASATTAHAASENFMEGMIQKLWRGVVNTLTGWTEFPIQIFKGYNEGFMGDEDNKVLGVIGGVFDGIGHSTGRTLSGISDIVGCWAADPESNEGVGIPLDGEYVWEGEVPYNLFSPDFTEATLVPIGTKLFRGLGNTLFGIAEVPGQIVKGVSEEASDFGIIKGLWYWFSREVAGVSDLVTVILPGPEETKGIEFDEEWPWEALADSL